MEGIQCNGCPIAEDGERERLAFCFDFAVDVLIYFHSLKEKGVWEPISTSPSHCEHWINANCCCHCAGLIWRWFSGNKSNLSIVLHGLYSEGVTE